MTENQNPARQTKMVGWQPIKTAPKDRQRILLWHPSWLHPTIGYWSEAYGVFIEHGTKDQKAGAATQWARLVSPKEQTGLPDYERGVRAGVEEALQIATEQARLMADLAIEGLPDNARQREAMEATLTRFSQGLRVTLEGFTTRGPSAVAALQAIADLPTPKNLERMNGHEDAYRAVEGLFATPPRVKATTPPPETRVVGLHLTEDQQKAILSVASRMEASPESVLKRAIGSYCAKYGGAGLIEDQDVTNVVELRGPVDNIVDSGDE